MVGVTGFEPATPCTPCRCATKLRHTPTPVSISQGLGANKLSGYGYCLSLNGCRWRVNRSGGHGLAWRSLLISIAQRLTLNLRATSRIFSTIGRFQSNPSGGIPTIAMVFRAMPSLMSFGTRQTKSSPHFSITRQRLRFNNFLAAFVGTKISTLEIPSSRIYVEGKGCLRLTLALTAPAGGLRVLAIAPATNAEGSP